MLLPVEKYRPYSWLSDGFTRIYADWRHAVAKADRWAGPRLWQWNCGFTVDWYCEDPNTSSVAVLRRDIRWRNQSTRPSESVRFVSSPAHTGIMELSVQQVSADSGTSRYQVDASRIRRVDRCYLLELFASATVTMSLRCLAVRFAIRHRLMNAWVCGSLLLTPTRVAGVKGSSASVRVSVCMMFVCTIEPTRLKIQSPNLLQR